MDKKAQTAKGIGGIISLMMGLIVGVILLLASAQNVGDVVNTIEVINQTETLAANGNSIYINEYKALSGVVIVNTSNGATISGAGYTVTNNVVNNGELTVEITTDLATHGSTSVEITGTGEPTSYDSTSSGRAIANLIIILSGVALLVYAVGYVTENYKD